MFLVAECKVRRSGRRQRRDQSRATLNLVQPDRPVATEIEDLEASFRGHA
jgi:hypothetical protein